MGTIRRLIRALTRRQRPVQHYHLHVNGTKQLTEPEMDRLAERYEGGLC